ncbi:MAG: type II toxin-antitoxin system HicB family antitoxin [Deltaproteobacteria bacterium]|nr:type II toxin-antitoxin system HicB family antitoxin [Deltaproteobacteria bacterium]
MKSFKPQVTTYYTFRVVVEPDEARWFAYCPLLEDRGAATWGHTKDEALKNLYEVLQLVLKTMAQHGETIPLEPVEDVKATAEPWVSVAV